MFFTGHDDATLERLQKELLPLMVKIKGNYERVPNWLRVNRQFVPDFLIKDPRQGFQDRSFIKFRQGCGSGSELDPDSIVSVDPDPDPDPGGQK